MTTYHDPSAFALAMKKAIEVKEAKTKKTLLKDYEHWQAQVSNQTGDSIKSFKVTNDTLEITFKGIQSIATKQGNIFLDLKPYFKQSKKVRYKKDKENKSILSEWYLIVPIRAKTRALKKASPSRSLYEQLIHSPFGTTVDLGANNLQEGLGTSQAHVINPLQYQWKSGNITRERYKNHGRYFAFRTVSQKSSPNSWIVGRQSVNKYNNAFSADMKKDIANAMKYQFNRFIKESR